MRAHRHLCLVALVLAAALPGAGATEALRIATYNVQELGSGPSYDAARDVLLRVNADIVLLQEVRTNESAALPGFAAAAGYAHYRLSGTSGTLSGGLQNAVLSKHPILAHVAWTSASASGDPAANDMTRNILEVVIAVPEVCHPVAVFSLHLKAGSGSTDEFRRAVELMRLEAAVAAHVANHPDDHIVIGGDFNEDLGDGPFGLTFNNLPSGLPASYKLGNDVTFPVVYDPFVAVAAIGGLGLSPVPATHEDSTTDDSTRISGRRLDYGYVQQLTRVLGDEVYLSSDDNGTDDGPQGLWLYKSGAPLPSGTSTSASDHYTVFFDYLLESCAGQRYGFGSVGGHLLIPRAGIRGSGAIGDAAFALRSLYGRPNAAEILVLGQSRMQPPFGFSLDPWVPGSSLHVNLAGLFGLFPAFADAGGRAQFSLPLPADPGIVGFTLNAQWFVQDLGAPNGVGAMTDACEVLIAP